ncbi:hypothetical protein HMPREF3151_08230 [Corynebacterium sp. HMSC05H05]|uniref:DUF4185 domain-containing protein n=1 Tax=unclassified Corynebacterium TaxID=2624378 RepID=UPI0008A56F4C|nr:MULTISPECIES: DUF4185 domain-containing protein [unclassified Corynebacterium]OFT57174.1 hypothetical protein HMPREF3151_08230 [Corynebacterium sp. HMSC05H05]OHR20838.1 hypothetical protein HMPREF2791_09185 [Corynebacterium sp. HMSC034A01]
MRTQTKPTILLSAGVASALALSTVAVPQAQAESSLSSLSSSSGTPAKKKREKKPWVPVEPPKKTASKPLRLPNGTTIQIMDDVLGKYSAHTGFRTGDLGAMAPMGNGEFAMIFGDSFRGNFGQGWMSPVGVVATMDEDGFIKILRPIDNASEVSDMISYHRVNDSTLIPSDVINVDGTLYLHGTFHAPFGNVVSSNVWKSDNGGSTWEEISSTRGNHMGGMTQLISWDQGPDGYIYATTTKFGRESPVYLWRFTPEDIDSPGNWEAYSAQIDDWTDQAEPILESGVKAGEMCLRYIDGHWVLVMFNEDNHDVEVRISETLERDWDDVRAVKIARNGSWDNKQTPLNWSQPYGGYIVPGSHLDDMDIVVSQWNTSDNSRYTATQFNVKGLDKVYGIDADEVREEPEVTEVKQESVGTPDMEAEDNLVNDKPELFMSSEDNDALNTLRTVGIILGVLAGIGVIGAVTLPMYRDMLPEPIQQMLPI